MKQLFTIRFFLLTCIIVMHIHCCLYTVNNPLNPITLIALIIRDDSLFSMLFIGCSIQTGISILIAYLLLRWKYLFSWLISYILGILLLYCFYRYLTPPLMSYVEHSKSAYYYTSFYGYTTAFIECIYYFILQLFILISYAFIERMIESFRSR